ncbi:MAG TPA: hypothetical protein VG326_07765 [Tepidisphaeraceae bacterium]|nr:hypothetical protein [Tepidisphaeraceae bacterium]
MAKWLGSRSKIHLALTGSILLGASVGGCGWQQPKAARQEKFDPSQSATIHMPPKEVVKLIQRNLPEPPLSLTVDSVQDGTIFTVWKEYEGAIHIARRWRERTRFKITVLPDFNDPLTLSRVSVFDETEERPSDPQPWYPNPDLRRPERSAQVLKMIQDVTRQ